MCLVCSFDQKQGLHSVENVTFFASAGRREYELLVNKRHPNGATFFDLWIARLLSGNERNEASIL